MRTKRNRIFAALAAGVATHLLIDAIPHSDYYRLGGSAIVAVVLVEIAAMGAFAGWLLGQRLVTQWRGVLLSGLSGSAVLDVKFIGRLVLPDEYARTVAHAGDLLHANFHSAPAGVITGMTTQVATVVALLVMLLLLRPRHSSRVRPMSGAVVRSVRPRFTPTDPEPHQRGSSLPAEAGEQAEERSGDCGDEDRARGSLIGSAGGRQVRD